MMNSITYTGSRSFVHSTILIPAYQPGEPLVHLVEELTKLGMQHILIVDDGSDESTHPYFLRAERLGARILHHDKNAGKGAALRTGIRAAKNLYPSDLGIVTADADGQHLPEDIHRVMAALEQHSDHLILGVRRFTGEDVPRRSRFGNRITSAFFRLSTGVKVADTQTGLRGIPRSLYDLALSTEGDRYEYEMHLLEDAVKEVPIFQLPITTVYEDGNNCSHFRPIRDSLRVYRRPIRFVAGSLLSSGLDLLLFWILMQVLPSDYALTITIATVIARAGSGVVNFTLNQFWCFKSKEKLTRSGRRYFILFILQMGLSAGLVSLMTTMLSAALPAKLLVDTGLSVFSYYIQKHWVFSRKDVQHGKYHQAAGAAL